jgi:hypothetical protein
MDETQFEPYKDLRNLAWAEVVVKLDKGRTLSASDYVLVVNGTECKCVAIAEDDKVYSLRDWAFNKTNMFGSYRLLFPAQGQVSEGELRFKLLASPLPDVPLKFRNMGSAPFTESSKLPVEGALGLSVQDVKNAKKPAASGDAAKK